MNPLGVALAFILFWLAIGLGLFLAFNSFLAIGRLRQAYAVAERGGAVVVRSVVNGLVAAIGLGMMAAGAYANYIMLYR